MQSHTSNLIYDTFSNTYGFDICGTFSSNLKWQLLNKYLQKNNTVLDMGCANGLFAFAASKLASNIVGIDLSQAMIDKALIRQKELQIYSIKFMQGDVTSLPFENESFDAVFAFSLLVLVPNPLQAISEALRVLKKDGILIVDITGKRNLTYLYWKIWYKLKGHSYFTGFTFPTLKKFFEKNNLTILEKHSLGICDQWKYIPLLKRLINLDKIFHANFKNDLDYKISNLPIMKPFSPRWYLVLKKY